ncbi:MAG: hypothetical protein Alpg2KO_24990 [Alphaproteobacteria bacterium]
MPIYQHDIRDGGRMRLGDATSITDDEWAVLRPETDWPALPDGAVIIRYDSQASKIIASNGHSQIDPSGFDIQAADALLADDELLVELQALRSASDDLTDNLTPAEEAINQIEDAANAVRSLVAARHATQIANYE